MSKDEDPEVSSVHQPQASEPSGALIYRSSRGQSRSVTTYHNTDIHHPFDRGSIQVGAWPFVVLPGNRRVPTIFVDPRHETLHEVLQPLQDEVLLGTRGPLSPTAAFGFEPVSSS